MKKNVCVYCSSSNYLNEIFYNTASKLGEELANNGFNLVYGGSTLGCMGKIAQAVHDNGGDVIGIIPEKIMQKCPANPNLTETIVTRDMRDRKALMEDKSDMFIALPGSFGTLDEIFEVIVNKQLGYNSKAIVFLDVDGYFGPLFEMLEKFYQYGFAKDFNRELYRISDSVEDTINYLLKYEAKEFVFKY